MPHRSPGRPAGRLSTFALVAAFATALAPAVARAQAAVAVTTVAEATIDTPTIDAPAIDSAVFTAPTLAPVGPTLDGARAGATRATSAAPLTVAEPVAGPRAGRPVALMVVGGTALVLGAIIGGSGGTAVAVGGAVVGLVGLYQFIR